MPYKTKEARREHYRKNKDEINRKRRKYNSKPEIKERKKQLEKEWRKNNIERLREKNKIYHKNYKIKLRNIVFNHYGWSCICCGESNPGFLTIDHIDGGGEKHRKEIHRHIHPWLIKNNFPKGFQTLCFNCNCGRHYNNGICPHKIKKEK